MIVAGISLGIMIAGIATGSVALVLFAVVLSTLSIF